MIPMYSKKRPAIARPYGERFIQALQGHGANSLTKIRGLYFCMQREMKFFESLFRINRMAAKIPGSMGYGLVLKPACTP